MRFKNVRKKMLYLVLLLFIALIVVSCSVKSNNIEESQSETEAIVLDESTENAVATDETDEYDVAAERKKSLKDAGIVEEVIDISYNEEGFVPIDITYPKLSSDDAIVQSSLDIVNEDLKKFAEKFKDEMKGVELSSEEVFDKENYRFSMDNTDVYATWFGDKYFSLRVFTYTDYMGAHPLYSIAGYTFDRTNGQRLSLYDLIDDKEKFRECLYDWCEKNKEEAGLFDEYKEVIDSYVDEKPLYDEVSSDIPKLQFCMYGDDKMTVIFQTYDIAPYASGAISIDIPKELLK